MTTKSNSTQEPTLTTQIKKIAVYTSGGDAPGMNAAIRSVVRTAIRLGLEVDGVEQGYVGMLEGKIHPLQLRDMANIIQRGGTILKTGRSNEFLKPEARKLAVQNLKKHGIDALVCIGGDGSFRGAKAIWDEFQIPIVGIPGTIDNDIYGTDCSIGFDTAVNTAMDAIDKIRDTADSHNRIFIVEVMGRNSGFIAAHVGLACGAEDIFTPEGNTTPEKAVEKIKESQKRGKTSSILIAAEGQKPGRAYDLADAIRKKCGIDPKVCILGHIQRGGAPSATDRVLASRLGAAAVDVLLKGQFSVMIGTEGNRITATPFDVVFANQKRMPIEYVSLANALAI